CLLLTKAASSLPVIVSHQCLTIDSDISVCVCVCVSVEKDGVVQPYNDSGVVDVYESCPDCLTAVYKSIHGRYLLSYRREGHHSDVEQLKAAHSDHRKQAECLGFPHDKAFSYDGAADFCHKKSSPEAKQEES
uniref:Uncharacterized protein n=1 Tax=Seriola lalandi dorsalis TaxID=1841481 RepID=A0A3B4WDB1_SERLL